MKRLGDIGQEISRWWDPISDSADGNAIPLDLLPISNITDPPAASEPLEQNLREKIKVAYQSGLEDDWYIRGVEQFDGESGSHSSVFFVHEFYFYFEALQIDD